MAKKGGSLRRALDRYKGTDYNKLKQRQQQKQAEKRRSRQEETDEATAPGTKSATDSAEWESDDDSGGLEEEETEDDEQVAFDLSRLDESDSDSELDEDADEDDAIARKKSHTAKSLGRSNNHETQDSDGEDDIPLSDLDDYDSEDHDIIPHQRLTINNTAALERALASISLPTASLPFSEHQSITTSDAVDIPDVEDDLNRELAFYAQSLSAVKDARSRLRKEGVPFSRPTDFFAEMVKSDEHMGKIKGKLLEDAAAKKASQDAKKQRELKKFGKQVQQEKLKERAKAKRDMLDKVKLLKRKRQDGGIETANEDDMFDVALEDAAVTAKKDREERKTKGGPSNAKRQKKNEKFGFGGKKRHAKSNDAQSSADMRGFSTKRMKSSSKMASSRPGKARRQKARLN